MRKRRVVSEVLAFSFGTSRGFYHIEGELKFLRYLKEQIEMQIKFSEEALADIEAARKNEVPDFSHPDDEQTGERVESEKAEAV